MSDRESLLVIAEWHRRVASENLKLAGRAKGHKKAYNNYIALADQHGAFAASLHAIAERQPAILSFRQLIREDRVICGHPVSGPTFSICNRDRGHAGAHRSATSSVECPVCHWGFAPSAIDQHIREKH